MLKFLPEIRNFINLKLIRYQATQDIIENMLEMMRVTGGWGNKKEFNSDLKRTIGYFRNKVDILFKFSLRSVAL